MNCTANAQSRLTAMLVLTTIFFMVEIIVGYITNSMALIADSFHMFSDAIALVIAYISVRMSPKKWSKNTFGWARAEILGALVNAVFLCALCFSILIESVKRFIKPDTVHDGHLILIVGGLGLFINLIGLLLFKEGHHHHHHHHHAHPHKHSSHHHLPTEQDNHLLVCHDDKSHDHHHHHYKHDPQNIKYGLLCNKDKEHTSSQDGFCNTAEESQTPSPDVQAEKVSSGDHNDRQNKKSTITKSPDCDKPKDNNCNQSSSNEVKTHQDNNQVIHNFQVDKCENLGQSKNDVHLSFRQVSGRNEHGGDAASHASSNHHQVDVKCITNGGSQKPVRHNHATSNQMNMRGVFLHVMADALGSVIVMISAIIVLYTDWSIRPYIDPILSVLMVCLILRSTWPLLTESAMILLQTVPTHIEVDSLRRRLTQEIPGVLAVHEFHVWQLAGDRIIASAHIRCHNLQDYMRIAEQVKEFFHNEGIHSTTIQPEFTDIDSNLLDDSNENCVLDCPSDQKPAHCAPQTCCSSS